MDLTPLPKKENLLLWLTLTLEMSTKKKLKTHSQKLYKKGCEGKVPRVGPWYVVCGPCYVVLACAFSLQEVLNSNICMLLVS